MCLILLEEKVSARKDLMFKERNDIDISDGFIQLSNKLPFLAGINIVSTTYRPAIFTRNIVVCISCLKFCLSVQVDVF